MKKSWQLAVGSWQKKQKRSFLLSTISSQLSTGFTLVEMIVSVALFAIVMVVAVGALLSLTLANHKAQATQSVMNNLNIALDGMVRNIRMGTHFDCVNGASTGPDTADCLNGGQEFIFTCNPDSTACGTGGVRWAYAFDSDGTLCGQRDSICKSEQGGAVNTWSPITAPEVDVSYMQFFVIGSKAGDTTQPKVIIEVKGTAGAQNAKTKSDFHIQATAVQRELDLQ